MKILTGLAFLLLLLVAGIAMPVTAEELGRLFLTPEQRQALDKLRYQKQPEQKLQEIVIEEEPAETEPAPVIGGIYVNGLVYRENGKSTAWVNQANSYQGDLGHRYLEIDGGAIGPEEVEIKIPSANKKVRLKVGEVYDPGLDDSGPPE